MDDKWRNRIEQRIEALDFTKASLSRAAGKGQTFIRDLLAGSTPSVENLALVAEQLGVTVGYILDGEAPIFQTVHVIGQAEAAETWVPFGDGSAAKAGIELRLDGGEAVAIEIHGDMLAPAYRNRDIVIGAKSIGRNVDNLIGLDCIVMTEDGRRYIRILQRGRAPGTFSLRSIIVGKADIESVRVAWAAPVTWIKRS
jgi:transcriptional regulator with XRE-family HTH domain